MALTALCYNWGFFTILGYAPFPMDLSPIKLGLVFFGWGLFVALFAVFGAPLAAGAGSASPGRCTPTSACSRCSPWASRSGR